jgi:hypothetical protein
MPGAAALPLLHQLPTLGKLAQIRAKLSREVPIERTLFMKSNLETMKSPKYLFSELTMVSHPRSKKDCSF